MITLLWLYLHYAVRYITSVCNHKRRHDEQFVDGSRSWVPHSSAILADTLSRFITFSKDAWFLRIRAFRRGLLPLFLCRIYKCGGILVLRFLTTLEFASAEITAMLWSVSAFNLAV